MKRILVIATAWAGLCAAVGVARAFEEQKAPQAPAGAAVQQALPGSEGARLGDAGVSVPRLDNGTKIRVPGLGVIGEIPKMDFGLELLYGASQPKQMPGDPSNDANGVMGRVTVPLKSGR